MCTGHPLNSETVNLRVQLTLRLEIFLRHLTFQAFYMHFGTVYTFSENAAVSLEPLASP